MADSILTKSFSLDSLQNLHGALYRHIDINLASDVNCDKASSGLKERMIPAFDWTKDELNIPSGIDPVVCGAYTYMEYSYTLPVGTTPIALIRSCDSTRTRGHIIAEDDELGGYVQGNVNGKFTYILKTVQMGYYDKNSVYCAVSYSNDAYATNIKIAADVIIFWASQCNDYN